MPEGVLVTLAVRCPTTSAQLAQCFFEGCFVITPQHTIVRQPLLPPVLVAALETSLLGAIV